MERLGYSYLIDRFALKVCQLHVQCCIGSGTAVASKSVADGTEIYYPKRLRPEDTWQGHLKFAIKYEGANLEALKALFAKLSSQEMSRLVNASPHSIYVRRLWFLYEFLTNSELAVPALKTGNYDYLLEPDKYFCLDKAHSWNAKRQRIICNLPGNAAFCPIVRMTPAIREYVHKNLSSNATDAIGGYPAELIYRASDFLYLKETKSSYAIERQSPSQKRIAAFMAILRDAGKSKLDKSLLVRLQNAIVEARYAEKDFRTDQVYVGQSLAPGRELVHFIGIKPEDLNAFMDAYLETAEKLVDSSCDAVICAAVLAFAFVFIHPFDDGNGRLHRYLMHHVLNAKGFCADNVIFPVSAALYKNAKLYDSMLESFSKRLLPLVEYNLAAEGEMTVENETVDFYRYIDFTQIVEQFYNVVEQTINHELLPELDYLSKWDLTCKRMLEIVDMPDRKLAQFILFIQQNHGQLPKSRRTLFAELSDEEISSLAQIVRENLITETDFNGG